MKKLLISIVILLPWLLAGQKEDYVWMFGEDANNPQDSFCTFSLNFNREPPAVEIVNALYYLYAAYGGICDSITGRLVYYWYMFTTEGLVPFRLVAVGVPARKQGKKDRFLARHRPTATSPWCSPLCPLCSNQNIYT